MLESSLKEIDATLIGIKPQFKEIKWKFKLRLTEITVVQYYPRQQSDPQGSVKLDKPHEPHYIQHINHTQSPQSLQQWSEQMSAARMLSASVIKIHGATFSNNYVSLKSTCNVSATNNSHNLALHNHFRDP